MSRNINLQTNLYEATPLPTQDIHHYLVTIDPRETPPTVCRNVWKCFEDSNGQGILKNVQIIYDGHMDAFSTKSLDLGEENAMSFQVKYFFYFPSSYSFFLLSLFLFHTSFYPLLFYTSFFTRIFTFFLILHVFYLLHYKYDAVNICLLSLRTDKHHALHTKKTPLKNRLFTLRTYFDTQKKFELFKNNCC